MIPLTSRLVGMASNTFLIVKTRSYTCYIWLAFCYNSMTVGVISFKPQKICTMMVNPCIE